MNEREKLYELAGGEVIVWQTDGTSIHLKLMSEYGDPVELNAEEARELAIVLNKLADSIE